jgi:hypothetical protein
LVAVLTLSALSCRAPDPKALLDVSDVDAYWAVEPSMGGEQYIAPVVRFRLHNRSDQELRSVQAMAVFRRKGEENLTWGSAFEQVVSRRAPLPPGQSVLVTLKSDARYHSTGPVEGMFTHPQFRDAVVEYFIRVGSSGWTSFGKADVARRLGPRTLAGELGVPSSSPFPTPPPSPSPSARR